MNAQNARAEHAEIAERTAIVQASSLRPLRALREILFSLLVTDGHAVPMGEIVFLLEEPGP